MLVVDASFLASALLDAGETGAWAIQRMAGEHLVAPHLIGAEITSVFRRVDLGGEIESSLTALALDDLALLPIERLAFEPFAERVWQLRHTVSPYDAWYVAVAESIDAPLATLDRRLATAPGPRCVFETFAE